MTFPNISTILLFIFFQGTISIAFGQQNNSSLSVFAFDVLINDGAKATISRDGEMITLTYRDYDRQLVKQSFTQVEAGLFLDESNKQALYFPPSWQAEGKLFWRTYAGLYKTTSSRTLKRAAPKSDEQYWVYGDGQMATRSLTLGIFHASEQNIHGFIANQKGNVLQCRGIQSGGETEVKIYKNQEVFGLLSGQFESYPPRKTMIQLAQTAQSLQLTPKLHGKMAHKSGVVSLLDYQIILPEFLMFRGLQDKLDNASSAWLKAIKTKLNQTTNANSRFLSARAYFLVRYMDDNIVSGEFYFEQPWGEVITKGITYDIHEDKILKYDDLFKPTTTIIEPENWYLMPNGILSSSPYSTLEGAQMTLVAWDSLKRDLNRKSVAWQLAKTSKS